MPRDPLPPFEQACLTNGSPFLYFQECAGAYADVVASCLSLTAVTHRDKEPDLEADKSDTGGALRQETRRSLLLMYSGIQEVFDHFLAAKTQLLCSASHKTPESTTMGKEIL